MKFIINVFICYYRAFEGNEIIKISPNIVYQDSTGVFPSQFNPAYITTSNIHTYEELPYSTGPDTNTEPPPLPPDRLPETVTTDNNDDDDYI